MEYCTDDHKGRPLDQINIFSTSRFHKANTFSRSHPEIPIVQNPKGFEYLSTDFD